MELGRSCCRPKPRPSLRSIFRSFIGLWLKIRQRNKTTYSESNPVQSSRSESTTCPRKRRLLRLGSNSTATSDGSAQRLEMMSGVILNHLQLEPKFAAKSVANEMLCVKAIQWPALTGRAWFVLNLKLSVLTFSRSMSCSCARLHWAKIVQSENPAQIYV